MDDAKLDYFKDILLKKRMSLSGIVQRTEDYGREKDQTQDITDIAVESYTREFLFSKSAGDRRVLRDIEDALARIDDRTFGICDSCGDEIGPGRLEAVPWAPLCIKCQGLLEKGKLD